MILFVLLKISGKRKKTNHTKLIANTFMNNQSVTVVSGNNSPTKNVYRKNEEECYFVFLIYQISG
ncbi:MAG: hypothetical protein K0R36_424 [Chryseobacterium sp.]|nr:hypothetical protein [Chryseobacterium sp.]